MATKGEKKRKNDNRTKDPKSKSANPITMEVDPNMNKPVRGLPEV
ncbi:MAG: hypothetical protein AB2417_15995 [Clostridiaceae bacterium]|nr:hypothetical protein [Clostridium mobile]